MRLVEGGLPACNVVIELNEFGSQRVRCKNAGATWLIWLALFVDICKITPFVIAYRTHGAAHARCMVVAT